MLRKNLYRQKWKLSNWLLVLSFSNVFICSRIVTATPGVRRDGAVRIRGWDCCLRGPRSQLGTGVHTPPSLPFSLHWPRGLQRNFMFSLPDCMLPFQKGFQQGVCDTVSEASFLFPFLSFPFPPHILCQKSLLSSNRYLLHILFILRTVQDHVERKQKKP